MLAKDYLQFLKDKIHSTVLATVDENGDPETRIVDMMLLEGTTLYFMTSSRKRLYRSLMKHPKVSITGVTTGENSLQKQSVTLNSSAICIGQEKLAEILQENPYMNEIVKSQYPSENEQKTLQVFKLEHGSGQFFDLSTTPASSRSFSW